LLGLLLVLTTLFLTPSLLQAQQTLEAQVRAFRSEEQRAMQILLGWSAVSLTGSGILALNKEYDQALMHSS